MQRNGHGRIIDAENPASKVGSDNVRQASESKSSITRDFFETVRERAEHSPPYRALLLQEAINVICEGDLGTAKLLLRDYVKATIGFEELGRRAGKSPKSLMRMLSVQGNPQASNLVVILRLLQEFEGIRFKIETVDAA